MLTTFLNTLATIISVTSLLIVTYGALIGIISFLINEFKRFTGKYSRVCAKTTFGRLVLLLNSHFSFILIQELCIWITYLNCKIKFFFLHFIFY